VEYTRHIHGKFFEMLPDGTEYSIDYPSIMTRLDRLGYDGYTAGEHDVTLRLKIRVAYIPMPFGGERARTVTV
jgi:hypothetical protein